MNKEIYSKVKIIQSKNKINKHTSTLTKAMQQAYTLNKPPIT